MNQSIKSSSIRSTIRVGHLSRGNKFWIYGCAAALSHISTRSLTWKSNSGPRTHSTPHPPCLIAGYVCRFLWGCLGLTVQAGGSVWRTYSPPPGFCWVDSSVSFVQPQEAYVCLKNGHSPFLETLQIRFLALQRWNRRPACLLKENTWSCQNGSISFFVNQASEVSRCSNLTLGQAALDNANTNAKTGTYNVKPWRE